MQLSVLWYFHLVSSSREITETRSIKQRVKVNFSEKNFFCVLLHECEGSIFDSSQGCVEISPIEINERIP